MPTYEFTCPNGHDFEKFFRTISSGEAELPCPVCGAIAQRKISAGAGLMFKGSGFYITDYGKDGKKDQASRTPASNGEGPSTSSTASDGASGGAESSPSGGSGSASEGKASDAKAAASESKKESKPSAPKPEPKASAPKSSNSTE